MNGASARAERARGVRRAMRALLGALLVCAAATTAAAHDAEPDEPELDDDSDSAPFMIAVEHETAGGGAGWRCAGSLVSLRTGVTSAECARGPRASETPQLWVLAAATAAGLAPRTDGARRVSRVATAGARHESPRAASAWSGALLDLAVLELERPFGSGARSRPILMATAPDECSSGVCHVVRSVPRSGPGGRRGTRLRIVDAALATDTACAQRVRYWSALRDRALCLTGPELCQSEWGAGVVCRGKLCGVVSRSASVGGRGDCGDTHAAQSVARWRRFLHCAHTLRACGRGACAELCNERQLLDEIGAVAGEASEGVASAAPEPPPEPQPVEPEPQPVEPEPQPAPKLRPTAAHLEPKVKPQPVKPATRVHAPPIHAAHHPQMDLAHLAAPHDAPLVSTRPPPPTRVRPSAGTERLPARPRTPPAPRRPPPTRTPPLPTPRPPPRPDAATSAPPPPASVRPAPLFEPNRPDFRAGEYGDNAADYGAPGEDVVPGLSTAAPYAGPPPPHPATSPSPSPPAAAPAPRPSSPASPRMPLTALLTTPAPPRMQPIVAFKSGTASLMKHSITLQLLLILYNMVLNNV